MLNITVHNADLSVVYTERNLACTLIMTYLQKVEQDPNDSFIGMLRNG
jgi:hypothetical protein